ncbi:MAG TPA: VTT domain-containing protein [Burkholderiales bacterium]
MQKDPREHPQRPAWRKLALIALVVVGLAATWRFTPLAELLTPERIGAWVRAAGGNRWTPVIIALAYTPAAFLMFPRPVLTLVAIVTLGVKVGLAASMAGIMVASLATYAAGRFLRRDTVRRLVGDRVDDATHIVRGHGVISVVAFNMLPVPPFGVQGIMAGAIRIKLWEYTVGTFLSLLPGALTITVLGEQIRTAVEDPSQVNYWVPALALAAFAVFLYFGRRWAAKRIA